MEEKSQGWSRDPWLNKQFPIEKKKNTFFIDTLHPAKKMKTSQLKMEEPFTLDHRQQELLLAYVQAPSDSRQKRKSL